MSGISSQKALENLALENLEKIRVLSAKLPNIFNDRLISNAICIDQDGRLFLHHSAFIDGLNFTGMRGHHANSDDLFVHWYDNSEFRLIGGYDFMFKINNVPEEHLMLVAENTMNQEQK